MLILTRRTGETVMIGDEVTVEVLSIRGNQVRLGINAPREIPVHREEIYRRIRGEQMPSGQRTEDYGHPQYGERQERQERQGRGARDGYNRGGPSRGQERRQEYRQPGNEQPYYEESNRQPGNDDADYDSRGNSAPHEPATEDPQHYRQPGNE